MTARRFKLIDCDGTLNVERHHLADPDQLGVHPGTGVAIRRFNQAVAEHGFDPAACMVGDKEMNASAIAHGAGFGHGLFICVRPRP